MEILKKLKLKIKEMKIIKKVVKKIFLENLPKE